MPVKTLACSETLMQQTSGFPHHRPAVPEMKTHLFQRGDTLRLEIAAAAFEGKAVARVDGLVVFVDGGVPGDVVQARITRVKRNHVEAVVVGIEQASPLRVHPRCVHFGVCGGCRWQHLDYSAQLRFKQQHVVDAFERIGGIKDMEVLPIVGSEEIFGYRNKMEYSFSDRQWIPHLTERESMPPQGVYLGLHVPQRYDRVLDLQECHLQSDLSIRILKRVRDYARESDLPVHSSPQESGYWRFLVIRQSRRTSEVMVNIVTFDDRPEVMEQLTATLLSEFPGITTVVNTINSRKAQIAYGEHEKVLHGGGFIHEQLGGYVFEISAGSFFQSNTPQAERLYGISTAARERSRSSYRGSFTRLSVWNRSRVRFGMRRRMCRGTESQTATSSWGISRTVSPGTPGGWHHIRCRG
jgi:23S rRNA (uracil1939-C5)-methyltransferase